MNTALDIQEPQSRAVVNDAPSMSIAEMTTDQMAFQLIKSGADFQSVREMVALSKELAAEKARNAFNEAVAAAKAEIPVVSKNAKGHNGKTYANFAAYAAVVDPVIAKHGLRYRFRTDQTDRITVTCVLSHKGGHSEENSLAGPADNSGSKNAIQAIGSTLTYLQRYTLIQALGLAAADDDDGQKHGKSDDQLATVTEDQLVQIRELLDATESDEKRFCEMGKIARLSDMPADQFDSAMGILKQRLAKRGRS